MNKLKTILVNMGLLAYLAFSLPGYAADVYGLDADKAQLLTCRYACEIAALESTLQQTSDQIRLGTFSGNNARYLQRKIMYQKRVLVKKITKENGFSYVDIDTTQFPEKERFYISIEIVDRHHPERLRFVPAISKPEHIAKKMRHKPDVIDAMSQYLEEVFQLTLAHQVKSSIRFTSCPAYHCLTDFSHPQLKPYLAKFNRGVMQDKKLILETLRHDPDPERRASAAFLIGHFPNPHEIVAVLIPIVKDPHHSVRNNAIRVLIFTLAKANITTIDIHPFLALLDSPYSNDRNKALNVLFVVAKSRASKQLVLQQAGNKLITLLRLKLPNNHDVAYDILKQISGKDFGPTNISAWTHWVVTAKSQMDHSSAHKPLKK